MSGFMQDSLAVSLLRFFLGLPRGVVALSALGALSESLFCTALAPQLPALDRALGLSHELSGFLVAGYSLGYWLGVIPAYQFLAWKSARVVAFLAMCCIAFASILFAIGFDFWLLFLARVLAGFGSVVIYAAVLGAAEAAVGSADRGAAIGTVYAGAAAGSAFGPVVGSLAIPFGRPTLFVALAVVQIAVGLLLVAMPARDVVPQLNLARLRRCLKDGMVWIGLWVSSFPGFAIGVLTVSGSYQLDLLGAEPWLIASAFSGIALLDLGLSPLIGQMSDRIGRRFPLLIAFGAASFALLLIVLVQLKLTTAVLIAVVGALLLAVGGPGLAMVGDRVERRGGDVGEATLLMNFFYGPTAALGAISAGLVHGAHGAESSFLILNAITFVSLILMARILKPAQL